MKKAFLILSLLGSFVASADDSYLYWMISEGKTFDYAKIRAANDPDTVFDNYLNVYDGTFAQLADQKVTSADYADAITYGDGFYAAVSSLPASFIVELYNSEDKFLGQAVISGDSVADYLYRGGMSSPTAAPKTLSTFMIPEPSSGLLMLVGCAVLGLRRRKQKNA